VVDDSPAANFGIMPCLFNRENESSDMLGDLITNIDGEKIRKAEDLRFAVETRQKGDRVQLVIYKQCDPKRVENVIVEVTTRDQLYVR